MTGSAGVANRGRLLLEDGRIFEGDCFGASATVVGEVVFHTGMSGYQEIMTDPSYKGQIVLLTSPHIGNTGFNPADDESGRPAVQGLLVREGCFAPSNYRSRVGLDEFMKMHGLPALHRFDTRALTRHIRSCGSMMGILSTESGSRQEWMERLKAHPPIGEQDLVEKVTVAEQQKWSESADPSWYGHGIFSEKNNYRIAALDFGIKRNILRLLTAAGFEVIVLPADTPAARILDLRPQGVFLSNGPGDPEKVPYAARTVAALVGRVPVFGICLGHQIIGLAMGARTYKLKYGHHGANHPVMDLRSRRIQITSQNHNYAVEPVSACDAGFSITHISLNDQTVEGMAHSTEAVFSVQYHPEASPGPHDALGLFLEFKRLLGRGKTKREPGKTKARKSGKE